MRVFTKEWLRAAHDDLLTIEELLDNPNLTHILAFHAQQCVEKLFKAILEEHEIDTPKIHKLLKLQNILPVKLADIDKDILNILDELYIESRYPGEMGLLPHGKPSTGDAKEFYAFAISTFNKVCILLNIDPKEV
ncbi:MAG: HEPN domain-containing protein [Thiovulaceae bacterium]|jgi:HEPN domain-containing protein|nr:HEPN domain-containing protein [Sulfurimonadaceae bacterium]MDD3816505.1 HEPN domain-containing protein [Sulfurimonadaceae bacterium]